ncbi:unnamed protein product, partial [marine sediment metagenome]
LNVLAELRKFIDSQKGLVGVDAQVRKLIDEGPTFNILIQPEFIEVRAMIVEALAPFPEAKRAVFEVLDSHGSDDDR